MKTTTLFSGWGMVLALLAITAGVRPVQAANACKADVAKFCSDVDMSDHKAVHACMKAHKDELSDDCKAQMAKMHAKMKSTAASASSAASDAAATPATNPAQ